MKPRPSGPEAIKIHISADQLAAATTLAIDQLSELGLDPTLPDAYQSAIDHKLFTIGETKADKVVDRALPLARFAALKTIRAGMAAITQVFLGPTPPRKIEGTFWLASREPAIGETIWEHPQVEEWCKEKIANEEAGLSGRSSTMNALLATLEVNYPKRSLEEVASGPAVVRGLIRNLRGRKEPDLSKETLDRRFESLTGIAQLEVAGIFLHDVDEIGDIGRPGAEYATRLARRHFPTLLANDLPAKRAMMTDLGAAFRDIQRRWPKGGTAEIMLDVLAKRSSNVATGIDEMLTTFTSLYNRLGFELPEALRPPVPETAAAIGSLSTATHAHVVPSLAPTITPEAEPLDPALLEEASAQRALHHENVAAFRRAWVMTATVKKPYRQLTQQLQLGFVDPAGNTLAAVPDPEAIVDLIAGLNRLAAGKDLDQAVAALRGAVAQQRALEREEQRLRSWEDEHRIPSRSSERVMVPQIQQLADRIIANQSLFMEAVRQLWPDDQGPDVASRINSLLSAWRQSAAKD